jgi:hypothetical protein
MVFYMLFDQELQALNKTSVDNPHKNNKYQAKK